MRKQASKQIEENKKRELFAFCLETQAYSGENDSSRLFSEGHD